MDEIEGYLEKQGEKKKGIDDPTHSRGGVCGLVRLVCTDLCANAFPIFEAQIHTVTQSYTTVEVTPGMKAIFMLPSFMHSVRTLS